jgi:hypothetical protein
LHSRETVAVIDHEVVSGVFAERQENRVSGGRQTQHHCEGRPVADYLRVLHTYRIGVVSDGNERSRHELASRYDEGPPE